MDATFEIKKHIGTIKEYPTGWTKEINIVSWCGNKPKYDIRDWNDDHTNMTKGVTLYDDEMEKLIEILNKYWEV